MPIATETAPQEVTSKLANISPLHETSEFEERCREFGQDVVRIVRFVSELEDNVSDEDQQVLAVKDSIAEAAAMRTGKLKLYKKGERDEEGIADNECWWTDAEAASSVVHDPDHMDSTRFMIDRKIYKDYRIEIHDVMQDKQGTIRTTLVRVMTKAALEAHISY